MNLDDVACRDLVDRITDLLEGRLTPAEEAAVQHHLEECPGCVAAVAQFRHTRAVLGQLAFDVAALDPTVLDGLVAAFLTRDRGDG